MRLNIKYLLLFALFLSSIAGAEEPGSGAGATAPVEASSAVTASPAPATHNIIISTMPAGASVFVDGKYAGISPATIMDLADGNHQVEFKKDDYERYESRIWTDKDRTALEFTLVPLKSVLIVDGMPPFAEVEVGGSGKVKARLVMDIAPGKYDLTVSKFGFMPSSQEIEIGPNKKYEIPYRLERDEELVDSINTRRFLYKTGAWTGAALAVAGTAAAVYFYSEASAARSAYDSAVSQAVMDQHMSDVKSNNRMTMISISVAVIGAGGGIASLFMIPDVPAGGE